MHWSEKGLSHPPPKPWEAGVGDLWPAGEGRGPAEESVKPIPTLNPGCTGPARSPDRLRGGREHCLSCKTRELERERRGRWGGPGRGAPDTHWGAGQGMLSVRTKALASHLQAWEGAF